MAILTFVGFALWWWIEGVVPVVDELAVPVLLGLIRIHSQLIRCFIFHSTITTNCWRCVQATNIIVQTGIDLQVNLEAVAVAELAVSVHTRFFVFVIFWIPFSTASDQDLTF